MHTRISKIVSNSGLTKTEFGKRINISQPYLSQLCGGGYTPSDRTIADISREFHVRREWLETGEGPMRLPEPDEDLDYINILMESCDSPFKDLIRAILVSYDRATPETKKILSDYIDQVYTELDKRK